MESRHLARLLATAAAALVAFTALAASAAAKPAPPYEQFAGCPTEAQSAATVNCIRSVITGGHFQMGSKDVPITNPITLTGGFDPATGNLSANSEGGLAPVKQQIPGGIVGITGLDWLVNFLNVEQLKLYAVTELAGVPILTGVNLTLPIKVHLINSALGNSCYVGSFAEPINLNLVTGKTSPPPPNVSISGKRPTAMFDLTTSILTNKEGIYVDNAFAAPGANGCVLTILGLIPINLNGLVNSQSGLPSPAGTNETTQNFESETVSRALVYP